MAILDNKKNRPDLEGVDDETKDTDPEQKEELEDKLGIDLDDDDTDDTEEDEDTENEEGEESDESGEESEEENEEGNNEDEESEEEENEEEDKSKKKPVKKDDKNDTDYKELYNASTRESIMQKNRNDKFSSAIEEAKSISDVTDDEIKAAYPGVDLTKVEAWQLQVMKDSIINKKRFERIGGVYEETKKVNDYAKKVDEFLGNEDNLNEFPQLRGREEAFKNFCISKPSRIGADLEEAVRSFSYGLKTSKRGGSLFHTNSNGNNKPVKKGLTAENVKWLRENRPKKYRELLKAGKLKFD